MVLKPNDSSSIYKDTTNNTGDGSPVGSATKSLYFRATLKPDGDNPTINPVISKPPLNFQSPIRKSYNEPQRNLPRKG